MTPIKVLYRHHFTYIALFFVLLTASQSLAADKGRYEAVAEELIIAVSGGTLSDAQAVEDKADVLTDIAVKEIERLATRAQRHGGLLKFVARSAPLMKGTTAELLENDWYYGEAIKREGYDFAALEHCPGVLRRVDALYHAVAALVAVRAFRESGDAGELRRASDELQTILGEYQMVRPRGSGECYM